MWTTAVDKLSAWLEGYRAVASAYPFATASYLSAMVALLAIAIVCSLRGRAATAYWSLVGTVLVYLVISFGEDIGHHVYRTLAVADQLRHGRPSLFLTTGPEALTLPTFVFYSFVPYLPTALLNLLGLSAHAALKVVMAAQILILAFGLRALIEEHKAEPQLRSAAWFGALLFFGANYVYGLWLTRAAYAEIWVYCLIPWVVLAILRRDGTMALLLFFVQVAIHPVMFAYASACSLVLAYGLSAERPLALLRRCLLPLLVAVAAGAPFWLPQLLWKDFIRGTVGIPVPFVDTFLSLADLMDRRYGRNIGLCLPLAILAMIALAGRRMPARAGWLTLAFIACLGVQTIYLRPIVADLPFVAYTQFIWRLMLPAALFGFAALLVGWPPRAIWILAALSLLSVLNMATVFIGTAPANLTLVLQPTSDASWHRDYTEKNAGYGKLEYDPNYTSLPVRPEPPDGPIQRATFEELRAGVIARDPYIAVAKAPVGLVHYTMNGAALQLQAYDNGLLLGPLPPGARVGVSESWPTGLLWLRLCLLALVAALAAVVVARRVRHN